MSLTPQRASRSTRWSPSCACQVKSPGETRGDWKCEGGSPALAGTGDGFADTDAPPRAPRLRVLARKTHSHARFQIPQVVFPNYREFVSTIQKPCKFKTTTVPRRRAAASLAMQMAFLGGAQLRHHPGSS